ncbi:MAG: hypothetical protein AB7V44_29285, partial [Pseudonocardia sp.]
MRWCGLAGWLGGCGVLIGVGGGDASLPRRGGGRVETGGAPDRSARLAGLFPVPADGRRGRAGWRAGPWVVAVRSGV